MINIYTYIHICICIFTNDFNIQVKWLLLDFIWTNILKYIVQRDLTNWKHYNSQFPILLYLSNIFKYWKISFQHFYNLSTPLQHNSFKTHLKDESILSEQCNEFDKCNHHHNKTWSNSFVLFPSESSPTSGLSQPLMRFPSLCLRFVISKFSYEENHSICTVVSGFSSLHTIFEIHPYC